jgi:hypothetical protein
MGIEEILGHVAGRFAQGIRPDDQVSKYYGGVVARYARHIVAVWGAASAAGIRCSVVVAGPVPQRCGGPAAGSCLVCAGAACLEHSHAAVHDGSLVCHACVGRAQREFGIVGPPKAAAGGPDPQRQACLKRLGLRPGVSINDIKARYRKVARERHPDRAKGEAQRRQFEEEIKEINQAYEWLVKHTPEEEAA